MPDSTLAWSSGREISRLAFIDEAYSWSRLLPANGHILNGVGDRYHFAMGLLAGWFAGSPTLMPSDQSQSQRMDLASNFSKIHELSYPPLKASKQGIGSSGLASLHALDLGSTAAIAFTSGSTGSPQPHAKSLESLKVSASLINRHLGGVKGVRMVATVPAQHMYGLELSVLLPWFEGAVLDSRRPFFPADVFQALQDGPSPVALVTTPIHLRALLAEERGDWPPVAFLVSATAPLPLEWAQDAERRFSAPLYEIYGCTELGSIAGRRPTQTNAWSWFEGVTCRMTGSGMEVRADHVPDPLMASDVLEPLSNHTFLLGHRNSDQINVAGKRGSLRALERAGLQVPGVMDIAFVQKDQEDAGVDRLAALVVLDGSATLASVKDGLRRILDPAFVPRTILQVDTLPHNAVGKLPRSELLAALMKGNQGR